MDVDISRLDSNEDTLALGRVSQCVYRRFDGWRVEDGMGGVKVRGWWGMGMSVSEGQ
jgi:hypothetical protein